MSPITSDSPLLDQVNYWIAHQRYPKFAGLGIAEPDKSWQIQMILHEGPGAWEREWETLRHLRARGEPGSLPEEALERLAATSRALWDPETMKPISSNEDWLDFVSCQLWPFFAGMDAGFDSAIVHLARDDQAEKPSRRSPWHRTVLFWLVESEEERRAILRRSLEPERPARSRKSAIRWLTACLPVDEALHQFLGAFKNEADPIVRYWAAFHLAYVFGRSFPVPGWVEEALWPGLGAEAMGDHYYDDELDFSARSAQALNTMGVATLRRTIAHLETQKSHSVSAWKEVLGWLICAHEDQYVDSVRERWRPAPGSPADEALEKFRRKYAALCRAIDEWKAELAHETMGINVIPAAFLECSPEFLAGLSGAQAFLKNLPRHLTKETSRWEATPGADKTRLARVRQLLQEATIAAEEQTSFLALLNSTVPFAVAENLLREDELTGMRSFPGKWNWNL